ncbi:MAG TPA: hypothetical protein VEX36_03155 [Thermoleophilaceae bacterium]|nr:hypothetical protein [Thermoleophilaceae bacterium]
MRDADRIKRYTLVQRSPPNGKPDGVRRFSLARVGDTPRSAVGGDRLDRLERMERIVEAERDVSRNGGDPEDDRRERDGPSPDGTQDRRS